MSYITLCFHSFHSHISETYTTLRVKISHWGTQRWAVATRFPGVAVETTLSPRQAACGLPALIRLPWGEMQMPGLHPVLLNQIVQVFVYLPAFKVPSQRGALFRKRRWWSQKRVHVAPHSGLQEVLGCTSTTSVHSRWPTRPWFKPHFNPWWLHGLGEIVQPLHLFPHL